MSTILCINMLLRYVNSEKEHIERILWIDPSGTEVVTIDTLDPRALPVRQMSETIQDGLRDGTIQLVKEDPLFGSIQEDEIPDSWRKRRDEAWNLIRPLVEESGSKIWDPYQRGAMIDAVCRETGRSKNTIYKFLRRYWQGGQCKNALLPRYDRCGAPGKERQDRGKKRGRPSLLDKIDPKKSGSNVDADIKGKILNGARLFHESKGMSLMDAYRHTLKHFFMEVTIGNGQPKYTLMDKYPTYDQFRYWYLKSRDYDKSLIRREGYKNFNLRSRPLLGESTDMTRGPGSVFQLDATVGDVYLISSIDRSSIVGRPVIYLVVDVFSRLIVGFYVGLDEPSYLCAAMALLNTFTNKVDLCKRYGIEITEQEWPSHHLPDVILADRGELKGIQANHIANSLGIIISNTSPYRADMKGLVEQMFRLLNINTIHKLPGSVPKKRERGERDYRLEATLNIYEFTQLVIHTILYLNCRRLTDYPLTQDMIAQNVEPYPVQLWHWGIQHRSGHLRVVDELKVCFSLLPRDRAVVTEHGIRFKGIYYTSPQPDWLSKSRTEGTWAVEIAYDPRDTNQIYLCLQDGKSFETCFIIQRSSQKAYINRSFEEVEADQKRRKIGHMQAFKGEVESWARFESDKAAIIERAQYEKSLQESLQGPRSKKKKLGKIRSNRKEELQRIQRGEVSVIEATETQDQQVQSIGEEDGYVAPVLDLEQWRKGRGNRDVDA